MIDGKLSLILPAHNEAANIQPVLEHVRSVLPRFVGKFEIIVVDDGSVDGTGALASMMSSDDERISVVFHSENRGYGAALRSGFAESDGDWVMVMDSDRQFDIGDLIYLAPLAGEYDLVAGYRVLRSDPYHRVLFGKIFRLAMRLLFGIQLYDIDCAFKVIRGDLLRSLPLNAEGAMISTELMARWARLGASWTQVGVHHYPRPAGEQSGGSLRVILRAIRDVPVLWVRLHRELAPVSVSGPTRQSSGISPGIAALAASVTVASFALVFGWLWRRN